MASQGEAFAEVEAADLGVGDKLGRAAPAEVGGSAIAGLGFTMQDVPPEDPASYAMLCRGDSVGTFTAAIISDFADDASPHGAVCAGEALQLLEFTQIRNINVSLRLKRAVIRESPKKRA